MSPREKVVLISVRCYSSCLSQLLRVSFGRTKRKMKDEARCYSRSPAKTVGAVLVTNLSTGVSKSAVDTAEVGTLDSVMGLPKELTLSLINQALDKGISQ
ncbi:hypothetical protein R1sor_023182 [Riccia sorocarpa]|uniref:Uncharacterized protein n=1 Tax=Riccia sorocarpa TaxID=122646 RepID=A0ABD3GNH1_9MARC